MTRNVLSNWPRNHYQEGGAEPYLFYVVFGCQIENLELSRSRHQCDGVPDGVGVLSYGPDDIDVVGSFREGYLWKALQQSDPELAALVAEQASCVVIRGTVVDDESLNYFRNTIGLVQALLDCGGVAVFDPQGFKWWARHVWTEDVFTPGKALPHLHTIILSSEDGDGRQWLHTRGMRKFGRPDLSIHGVSFEYQEAAIELLNRFIEFQAYGGLVAEGQPVRMAPFPTGIYCVHAGDEDDPDFNNSHIEIKWPGVAASKDDLGFLPTWRGA